MSSTQRRYQFKQISPIRILSLDDSPKIRTNPATNIRTNPANPGVNGSGSFKLHREIVSSSFMSLRDVFLAPLMAAFGDGADEEQLTEAIAEKVLTEISNEDRAVKEEEKCLELDYLAETTAIVEEAGEPMTFNRVFYQYKMKTHKKTDRHDQYMRCITQCNAMKKTFPEQNKLIGKMICARFHCA